MSISQTAIVNVCMTLLGEDRVASIDDNVKQARAAKAMWDVSRDSLLAAYNWSFAKARASLSPLAEAPLNQFSRKFLMPSDCLRVIMVSSVYVGLDLTDYRGTPTEEYCIEGREILTDLENPLPIRYVKRVTDTTLFQPNFSKGLGAQLAMDLCEELTQSETKIENARIFLREQIKLAVRANAIELPPQKQPDDEWLMSRL